MGDFIDYGKAAQAKAPVNRKPYLTQTGVEAICLITKFAQVDGFKGKSVVVELKVLESKATLPGVTPPQPGAEFAHIIKGFTGGENDPAMGKVKALALALNGKELPGLNEEQRRTMAAEGKTVNEMAMADGMAQGAAMKAILAEAEGSHIRVNTYDTIIKTGPNAGKPFTVVQFSHVPGQSLADIRARAGRA